MVVKDFFRDLISNGRLKNFCFLLVLIAGLFDLPAAGQVIVWEGEAEDGTISGTAEVWEGCAFASGGLFVRMNADPGNTLLLKDIVAQRSGTHLLVIHYFYVGTSALELLVNGVSTDTLEFPSATWCYQGPPAEFPVTIPLAEGTNEILLRPTGGPPGSFIDRLQIIDEQAVRVPRAYYVSSGSGADSNPGTTAEAPWKSLDKIRNSNFIPGDSILFRAGDRFAGQLIVNGSGSAGNPILITSYGEGEKPVIDGAAATGGAYEAAVLLNNQGFIEISGLEITNDRRIPRAGQDDQVGYGIFVLNNGYEVMEHFYFHNLVIREVYAITTSGVDFNALKVGGIYFRSERNQVAGEEKHIRDVLVDSCFITRTGKFGIWTQHAGGDPGIGNDSLNRNMNLVFRHNHMFETGGSGITPGRSYNCLVEHNTFEYTGSDADPRMAKRGSGAWFFGCRNVIAQYNTSLHVRGPADSYGMHIDFGNRNVILQYNYSEDSEGGFVEILGKNVNSVYRFNVSVNDGIRSIKGNSIWISTYAGTDNRVPSDSNYVYNNTIYVDEAISPDIFIEGKNSFIYNNIFYTTGDAAIGNETHVSTSAGGTLEVSNNLFHGNINASFAELDMAPVSGDPLFSDPSAGDPSGFSLQPGSPAISSAATFPEPVFPMAGKGIFSGVSQTPKADMFGHSVDLSGPGTNIGAWNGDPLASVPIPGHGADPGFILYPNPAGDAVFLQFPGANPGHYTMEISDMKGRLLFREGRVLGPGKQRIYLLLPDNIRDGVYAVTLRKESRTLTRRLVVRRQ